ncbi:unnamed protein product [Microthlaspi erraticum]|uniref:Reverse transcriptase Ty1/copia-type domain-containing protein n=1 Tax=Microthlaspi erraticum TaxID=1685480 RepID=A0A6D2K9I9_9BRAS|nr:unnamed protein product [Microthlaspi erraticum]
MMEEFSMTDLGNMRYFLGVEVKQDEQGIFIHQKKYAMEILKSFGMQDCNSVKNPTVPGCKLTKEGAGSAVDSTTFKKIVGSLSYLTPTRPDLIYSVNLESRYMESPNEQHMLAAKIIMRYIQGTTSHGIQYLRQYGEEELVGYVDSDYAGDEDDRKSTSGYTFMYGNGAVSWSSTYQIGYHQEGVTVLFCDNSSTIKLSKNPVLHGRSKHIHVRYHFLRELVNEEVIRLEYCHTQEQLSDIMTKPVKLEVFEKLRSEMGVGVDKFVEYYFELLQIKDRVYLLHRLYEENSLITRPGTDGMESFTIKDYDNRLNMLSYGGFESAVILNIDPGKSIHGKREVTVHGSFTSKDKDRSKRQFTQIFFLSPEDNEYKVVSDKFYFDDRIKNIHSANSEKIMSIDLTPYLNDVSSADRGRSTKAMDYLKQLREKSFHDFLLNLTSQISKKVNAETLKVAGDMLKESLDTKDSAGEVHRWLVIDGIHKDQIKEQLVVNLGSSMVEVRQMSAQIIVKIATIEIPKKQQWCGDSGIFESMKSQSNARLKQSIVVETLGYVCEQISHHDLEQKEVSDFLRELLDIIDREDGNTELRLAATKALDSVLLYQKSFEDVDIAKWVLDILFKKTNSKEADIKNSVIKCLGSIASKNYQYLVEQKFMDKFMDRLVAVTSDLDGRDGESAAVHAIKVWCSICEGKIAQQCVKVGDTNGSIEKALHDLVPKLLASLTMQDKKPDIFEAGRTCLGLVARTLGDDIVPHVSAFFEENVMTTDCDGKKAAIYAFGSIFEGPTADKLSEIVAADLKIILAATKDENKHVRDATVWTLKRLLKFFHSQNNQFSSISPEDMLQIGRAILNATVDEPNVPDKICRALSPFLEAIVTNTFHQEEHLSVLPEKEHLSVLQEKEQLSVLQKRALRELTHQLRTFLQASPECEKTIWGIPLLEQEGSEIVLMKFLRAKNFKVQETLNMLKETMEWRKTSDIDTKVHSSLDHLNSKFMHGVDVSGHPVLYEKVFCDFSIDILSDETALGNFVTNFVTSRTMVMEKTIREQYSLSGVVSPILHVIDLHNHLGLSGTQRDTISRLTKPGLKLLQNHYSDFAFKQIFINTTMKEYIYFKLMSLRLASSSMSREIVLARKSKSFKTLTKYIKPNQIPTQFGGLSNKPEDFSVNDISSSISINPGRRKTLEIECPVVCEINLTFRSVGSCLTYTSAFFPGTFSTTEEGKSTFTQASDENVFTEIPVERKTVDSSTLFSCTFTAHSR